MRKVEQIDGAKVVLDYDVKKTPTEIKCILEKYFESVNRENSIYTVKVNGHELIFLIKNITYLGYPHPIHKKRIQLSNGWEKKLQESNVHLMGIYNYNKTRLFVHFEKHNYISRKLNNSSVHVWTLDLFKGNEMGIFNKVDFNNNKINVIREDKFLNYIESTFIDKKEIANQEIKLFENFARTLKRKWYGINCYKEMIEAKFTNRFQAEWGGFYFEFKFENFLNTNQYYKKICTFVKNKKKGGIDLDLNFNDKYLGDLKTHSEDSNAILGNDFDNFNNALEKYGKIWYIILNHKTKKDSECGYEVTKFWNEVQKKRDLLSYKDRMKNTLMLKNLFIIEINEFNKKYLENFNQGKNSDGRKRCPKVKINIKDIDNFLLCRIDINNTNSIVSKLKLFKIILIIIAFLGNKFISIPKFK